MFCHVIHIIMIIIQWHRLECVRLAVITAWDAIVGRTRARNLRVWVLCVHLKAYAVHYVMITCGMSCRSFGRLFIQPVAACKRVQNPALPPWIPFSPPPHLTSMPAVHIYIYTLNSSVFTAGNHVLHTLTRSHGPYSIQILHAAKSTTLLRYTHAHTKAIRKW